MSTEGAYQTLVNEGYTEEQIQAIMELGLFPEEQKQIDRESALATGLRNREAPDGREVSNGRIFVSSGLGEVAGGLAEVGAGQYKQNQLDQRSRDIADEQVKRRLEFLRGGGVKPNGALPVPGAPTMNQGGQGGPTMNQAQPQAYMPSIMSPGRDLPRY